MNPLASNRVSQTAAETAKQQKTEKTLFLYNNKIIRQQGIN